MKKIIKIFAFILFFLINTPLVNASTEGNRIADTGAKLACGTTRIYAQWSSTRIYNDVTKKYIDARDKVIVNAPNDDGSYASCDVGVATIVRTSGVDTKFEAFLVPNQLNYLNSSSDWKRVGIYYKGNSTVSLQPGDVMIMDPAVNTSGNKYMHIWLYLGNSAVRKYYPNSNYDSVEAGYNSYENGSYYPTLFSAQENASGDTRTYAIYRYDGTDYVQLVLNWARSELAKSSFTVDEVDVCKLISDTLQDMLKDLFNLILVVAIILVVILTIIDLIKIITGNAEEKFQEFGKHIKARIITLIILLLLPLIITFLINTINNVATISGYNSDNPLCGITSENA